LSLVFNIALELERALLLCLLTTEIFQVDHSQGPERAPGEQLLVLVLVFVFNALVRVEVQKYWLKEL